MKCTHCGSANADPATLCASCGQPLGPPPPPPPGYPYGPGSPSKRSGTSPWLIAGLIVGGGCILLLPVVAIMAAVLFPVFAQARGKAQQTSCLSNIRQLQTAVLSYEMDWREAHPPANAWSDRVMPYVLSPQVFLCPEAGSTSGSDYWTNRALDRVTLADITEPAATASLFDAPNRWNGAGGSSDVACRHNGGANFGFVDGHAKWMTQADVPHAVWSVGATPWRGLSP